jgi:LPS export ABC transporter protein LptC
MEKFKIIFLMILFFNFCGKEKKEKVYNKPEGIEKFHLKESKGQIPSFELFADNSIIKEDSIFLYTFKVIFYDSSGKKIGEIKADTGFVDRKKLNILARGKVCLKTEKESLFTNEMLWIDSLKIAKSEKDVVFYHENNVTYGKGFITKKNLKEIMIIGRVKGEGE